VPVPILLERLVEGLGALADVAPDVVGPRSVGSERTGLELGSLVQDLRDLRLGLGRERALCGLGDRLVPLGAPRDGRRREEEQD
jgi:hypothetical protein